MKTRYEITENGGKNYVLDFPNVCILNRLKKIKYSSSLVKSLNSETDDGLLSSSNFPERHTPEELEVNKPGLPEIKHPVGKVSNKQLEDIKDVLDRNQDVFFRNIKQTSGAVISLNMK